MKERGQQDASTNLTLHHSARKRQLLAIATIAVLVVTAGYGIYGIWWDLDDTQSAKERNTAAINLHSIGIAMYEFHDVRQHFPPASITVDGEPGLSWRVHLLPFLDGPNAAEYFDFTSTNPGTAHTTLSLWSACRSITSHQDSISLQATPALLPPAAPIRSGST